MFYRPKICLLMPSTSMALASSVFSQLGNKDAIGRWHDAATGTPNIMPTAGIALILMRRRAGQLSTTRKLMDDYIMER